MGAPVRRLHAEINDLARGASAASPCLVWMRSDPGSKPGTKSGRSGRHERRSGDVRIGVVAWQDGVRPYNAPRSVRGLRACGTCSESHCVAGVVRLELRNPLGSKSARVSREFLPIRAKRRSRDGSRPSCGVANAQLRQGFRLALWGRKGEKHGGGAVQYAWLVGFELW
jgi:hypothetical protein